jgi:putative oxidoreductase
MDFGLLILRVVVGAYLFGHGAQKLFGWFGGGGLQGMQAAVTRFGFRPASFWALMAGLSEAGGGVLSFLGLLSPLGSFGIAAAMLVAIRTVHWGKGWWNTKGGVELPLTNLTAATAIALTGPGRFSLDRAIGISLPEPTVAIVLMVLLLAGLVAAYASKRAAAAAPRSQGSSA